MTNRIAEIARERKPDYAPFTAVPDWHLEGYAGDVARRTVTEFAEELKDLPHFDAQGGAVDATLRDWMGEK